MIHLLVSFDKNYINPFKVMINSCLINTPNETFHVWLLHKDINQEDQSNLLTGLDSSRIQLTAIQVDQSLFQEATITNRYPQEMYYRLIAPLILPKELDRILYIDPDILVINSIKPLWEINLQDYTFGACSHAGMLDIINSINQVRLNTNHDYFNTGVILMDLKRARDIIDLNTIFSRVNERSIELLLPDQDVFNQLYGKYTLPLDETLYNYDARNYQQYYLRSNTEHDIDWVIQNTIILHFCGKQKPWKKRISTRFSTLYKHYQHKQQQNL